MPVSASVQIVAGAGERSKVGRAWIAAESIPAIGLRWILALAALDAVLAWVAGIHLLHVRDATLFVLGPLAAGLVVGHVPPLRPIARVIQGIGLWTALILLGTTLVYLALGWGFPLRDRELARADRFLGFDWTAWVQVVESHHWLERASAVIYRSLIPQKLLAVCLLSSERLAPRAYELWRAAFLALCLTAIIQGLAPAVGAYAHYGIHLERAPHVQEYLAVHAGAVRGLSVLALQSVVSMPSYHVVCAVLLVYAYRGLRLFPYVCVWNLAMVLTVFSEGGHYLVDAVAGSALACLVIWLGRVHAGAAMAAARDRAGQSHERASG